MESSRETGEELSAHRGRRKSGRTYSRRETKKKAVGEKHKLIERQRQRASQPVRQKKKQGKQRVWKRTNREERENQSAIAGCHSHWLITAACKTACGVCECVCVLISLKPLAAEGWGVHDLPNHRWEGPCSLPSVFLPAAQTHTQACACTHR